MFMSREGRKLIDYIYSIGKTRGIDVNYSILDMMCSDILISKYYTNIVLNTLKTKLKSSRTDKHHSVSYWLPVIENMYRMNQSANRNNNVNINKDIQLISISYQLISEYVITDYSIDDAVMVCHILNEHDYDDIQNAIKLAKQQHIYEIRYIGAILAKEGAKKRVFNEIQERISTISQSSNKYLDEQVKQRTIMDVAQIEYNWNKTKENTELEKKFAEFVSRRGLDEKI